MARTIRVRKADLPPSPEGETSPSPTPAADTRAGGRAPVAWSGTADLLVDPPDDMATARMLVFAVLGGLAFWILLAVWLIT